ncbi:hypothetical protein ACS7SF_00025 [Ralstonia sp. 25C]|uniref:hypothetical protein n=1 Tax=Ralstonia sp. 25C TaxID=3447363 RepID=UPI003F75358F
MTQGRRQTLISATLAQTEWPTPSQAAIDALGEAEEQRYHVRKQAVELVRANKPFKLITQHTGLSRSEVRRLVKKCLEGADDGRIAGYRALVTNAFRKAYERSKPVQPNEFKGKGGAAGAWGLLLRTIPGLNETIEELVFPPITREGPLPLNIDDVWGACLLHFQQAGLTDNDYPLNSTEQGKRALREYIKRLEEQYGDRTVRLRGGKNAEQRWRMIRLTQKRLIGPRRPGTFVILDYHLVDARTVVIMRSPTGEEYPIELPRWYIGVLVDEHLGTILGVTATLEVNPTYSDTLQTLDCMIHPQRYIESDLNGLEFADDKIFIQQMVPEHANASFSVLRVDNAWANAANAVIRNAVYNFGASVQFGPSRCWMARPVVERVIKEIATRGPQTAPSSTGSNPMSGLHSDAGEQAQKFVVTVEELMRIIFRAVREHNAARTERLAYSDASLVLSRAYQDPDKPLPGARLPRATIDNGTLLYETVICPVVGNLKKGIRPHINWSGRYSNRELEDRPDLIGKNLICFIAHYNCDIMYAVIEETSVSLGRLVPAKPYDPPRSIRHARYLRREGRGRQTKQRAEAAQARAAERAQTKRQRKNNAAKDTLRGARVEQDARRFPAENPAPQKTVAPPVTQSANDDLKGWTGTRDPFGLTVVKRRRPA